MIAILRKEIADYFGSIRFIVLFFLILLATAGGLYAAYQGIRAAITATSAVTGTGFVFLRLFTSSAGALPPLASFLTLFVPIIGIALGFDAINSERSGGTLSRILAQPVYRDGVINGKFLAGMATLTIMVSTTIFLVAGYGLRMIGVPPTAEEIIRLFIYLAATLVFGAFWMGIAILFSVLFRKVAASLLLALTVWLFFSIFWPVLSTPIANWIAPATANSPISVQIHNYEVGQTLLRISPTYLYGEATTVLLLPQALGTLGVVTPSDVQYMLPNPLSLGQSLLIIWPHLVTLLSLSVVCFAVSYVLFMRQEIRAT